ncbi:hypothetical protein FALBO_1172 [Fusarium albosuccineum]|uniref:Glycine-rich domain-containing protein 1 n=1 Tax=Fusarium albosuccineum TaxID=1237068 RepID=A0A8H4PHT8_9HYPO|nr:hypothetical protein FALBO_1172 [Fusarium albosuccineum]
MALESSDTKSSLHKLGKDMVLATTRQHGPDGKPYQLSTKPQDKPIIPDLAIFNFDDEQKPHNSDVSLPRVAECAAHLEFLETLYVLRQRIFVSKEFDDAMDIKPNRETKTGHVGDTKTFKDNTFWERRQQKWPKYIEFAVIRFLAWRRRINQGVYETITSDNLPPIDVLMVWHSFMLNPRLYLSHCSDEPLFNLKFPWKHIHDAVDNDKWSFHLKPAAAAYYQAAFEISHDLFDRFKRWGSESQPYISNQLRNCKITTAAGDSTDQRTTYPLLFKTFRSSLAEKLRDAVIRQTAFIDKMNAHMWIRSPSLEGTMRRSIDRYQKFCKLMKLAKGRTVVPTLDIDLAWHTHQCSAKEYGQDMKTLVGKFINHDDTIAKPKLGDGAQETRRLYRIHFGQEYRLCGCWDCEALQSELEKAVDGEYEETDMESIARRVKEEVFYYRAVEWSRRREMTLPIRRD